MAQKGRGAVLLSLIMAIMAVYWIVQASSLGVPPLFIAGGVVITGIVWIALLRTIVNTIRRRLLPCPAGAAETRIQSQTVRCSAKHLRVSLP